MKSATKKNTIVLFFGLSTFSLFLLFSGTALGATAQIKSFCKKNYGKKLTTYEQCVLSQTNSKRFIEKSKAEESIKQFCKRWNLTNWVKQKFCVTSQEKAKTEIKSIKADPMIKFTCEAAYREDLVLQRNCILKEIEP